MKNVIIQQDDKYYKKCKVVMLPTEERIAKLQMFADNLVYNTYNLGLNNGGQHLYILSDEEIKEGDWVYCETGTDLKNKLFQIQSIGARLNAKQYKWKKIIATTDTSLTITPYEWKAEDVDKIRTKLPRPSNEFIQKYVEMQGGIDEVYVECEDYAISNQDSEKSGYKLKVNQDNTITIRPVEDKVIEMTEKQARQDLKSLRSKFQHIIKYYPLSDKEILEDQIQDIFKDLEKVSIIGEEQEKLYSLKQLGNAYQAGRTNNEVEFLKMMKL